MKVARYIFAICVVCLPFLQACGLHSLHAEGKVDVETVEEDNESKE